MTTHWRCLQCPTVGVTDAAAARHTAATSHATVTSTAAWGEREVGG